MQLADFDFQLPDHLIARYPLQQRTASRLLCLDGNSGDINHCHFSDLTRLIEPGDLLVFNNTRVIPARLKGKKATGGKIEILIERLLSDHQALAHIRASKSPKPDSVIMLEDGTSLTVLGRKNDLFLLEAGPDTNLGQLLESIGHMPLPPYIDRPDEALDRERYQTVYNQHKGAVAAPTAGLHFSEQLIQQLQQQGIETGFVTLHVGAGTFQPVRVDRVVDHKMHSEWFEVTAELVQQVKTTRARGGKVIAVGTTTVRCLESASAEGELAAFSGDTDIFIYPGYQFKMVDVLITNFHLPQSTLIMLVSAFAGKQHILAAYQEAIAEQYRFYSYGDAMFLTMNTNNMGTN